MARLVEEPKIYTIELTQGEVNHITASLGGYSQDSIENRAIDVHGVRAVDNDLLYNFFLSISESNQRRYIK